MLLGLEMHLRAMRESSRQVPGAIAQLKRSLSDNTDVSGPQRVAIEGQIRDFERAQKMTLDDIEVYERVLADAMKRSESSEETSATR
jgi:hypothetical protein